MCATVETVGGRARDCRARRIVLLAVLLAVCRCGFALNPNLDVSQYAHTSWKVREGFTKGVLSSVAQTPDGYLWLGTDLGLLRFDGIRSVPFHPPAGQNLPSNDIWSLVAARDGTLWIGTDKGLASFKDGRVTQYAELAGLFVFHILEDRDGTVWVAGFGLPSGRLCAIENGKAHCWGQDGSLGRGVFALYEDSEGSLWVGVQDGLWRWKPGLSDFYPLPNEIDSIRALAEDDSGALLITTHTGIKRFVNGKVEPYSLLGNVEPFRFQGMLRDRDGSLWIATAVHGVVHVHQERVDIFTRSNGLSGDAVRYLFEDREGNIWAVTSSGLDRFRELAVATVSVEQGLSSASVGSVLAAHDQTVWISTVDGLDRWNDGKVTIARTGSPKQDGKLNGDAPNSLFQDSRGRIWVSTFHGFGYLDNGRFISITGIPGGAVHGIAEDNSGNLWIANQNNGLFGVSLRGEVQQIPWAGLGNKGHANALFADPLQGGIWIGFFNGGIAYFKDGAVRASYGTADGLGDGAVHSFRVGQDGTLWVATHGGLSRLKNGRFATLTSNNGLPCDTVHWMMEDDDHSFWLHTACGLARVARTDIDAWAAWVDKSTTLPDQNQKLVIPASIRTTVFDSSDGVMSRAYPGGFRPLVAKAWDGKLWFVGDGVSILDPRHIPFNKLPPPVHIEEVIADHKAYPLASANGQVRLPARIRDLQIDYAALSLSAPEKVLFRYKLEGWDRDWQDAGTRRQAFYNNLPPRNYRFRVMACNNSGVWNEAGESLGFSVAPAYYQTNWFRLLCVAAFLAALWGLYQFRLRQLAQEFNMRLDERISERTRIARELHDTLLQNVQGLILKMHAIGQRIPMADPTRLEIEKTLDYADQILAEGRDRVRNLRTSTIGFGQLPKAFKELVEEAAPNRSSTFKTVVEGTVLELHPIIREETYSIGREALINALTHSDAHTIEVEITYDSREFRLRIRDDGRGIGPGVLEKGGRDEHWGLQGMRERAKRIGGKLDLWSRLGSGTEIELTVPASTAYRSLGRKPSGSRPRISDAD
jgi:ligand-binding sensor domain-containing protein/signal transduction histidine kinase